MVFLNHIFLSPSGYQTSNPLPSSTIPIVGHPHISVVPSFKGLNAQVSVIDTRPKPYVTPPNVNRPSGSTTHSNSAPLRQQKKDHLPGPSGSSSTGGKKSKKKSLQEITEKLLVDKSPEQGEKRKDLEDGSPRGAKKLKPSSLDIEADPIDDFSGLDVAMNLPVTPSKKDEAKKVEVEDEEEEYEAEDEAEEDEAVGEEEDEAVGEEEDEAVGEEEDEADGEEEDEADGEGEDEADGEGEENEVDGEEVNMEESGHETATLDENEEENANEDSEPLDHDSSEDGENSKEEGEEEGDEEGEDPLAMHEEEEENEEDRNSSDAEGGESSRSSDVGSVEKGSSDEEDASDDENESEVEEQDSDEEEREKERDADWDEEEEGLTQAELKKRRSDQSRAATYDLAKKRREEEAEELSKVDLKSLSPNSRQIAILKKQRHALLANLDNFGDEVPETGNLEKHSHL